MQTRDEGIDLRIYLANNSAPEFHFLAGKYGQVGWLLGPESINHTKYKNRYWIPLAFDNDAYSVKEGEQWDEAKWFAMLDKIEADNLKPEWVLLPDKLYDKEETIKNFYAYRHHLTRPGREWPVAFAVQDGMVAQDVPCTADVIFVGGSTKWKWKSLPMWTQCFPRVHVGRVNSPERLDTCKRLGVESVDGTHWFRFRKPEEWCGMFVDFFEGVPSPQLDMFEVLE